MSVRGTVAAPDNSAPPSLRPSLSLKPPPDPGFAALRRSARAAIVIPLTFLGCVYYSWSSLVAIRWLQILVLLNPLVYMCEGFRAALTPSTHMSLWAVYPAMIGFSVLFTWLGVNGFKKRALS